MELSNVFFNIVVFPITKIKAACKKFYGYRKYRFYDSFCSENAYLFCRMKHDVFLPWLTFCVPGVMAITGLYVDSSVT